MPVATARKIEALRADFRSAAQLADLLAVSRSQITRWLRGAGIDPLNAERVDLLELVWSSLLRVYIGGRALLALRHQPAARRSAADRSGARRPHRRTDARHPGGAVRLLRVILHRCFPLSARARVDAADGPLWFPRPLQGEGRHDNPDVYGCLYLSDRPVSPVVEQLAAFRGQRLSASLLRRRGLPLALAEIELDADQALIDLDDPPDARPRTIEAIAGGDPAPPGHPAAGAGSLPAASAGGRTAGGGRCGNPNGRTSPCSTAPGRRCGYCGLRC